MKRLLRDLSIFIAVLLIAGLCPISVIYVLFIDCDILPDAKLTTVDLGAHHTLSLYGGRCWEVSRDIYYEVYQGRKIIIPKTLYGFEKPDQNYDLKVVSHESNDVIGVYDTDRNADEFFIVIDLGVKQAWPAFNDGEKRQSQNRALIKLLGQMHPEIVQTSTPRPTVILPTANTTLSAPTPTSTPVIRTR